MIASKIYIPDVVGWETFPDDADLDVAAVLGCRC
jgi:hypothetical protein